MASPRADSMNTSSAKMSYEEIDLTGQPSEDDIDIDIDLSTALQDEDYIIEDVHSDVEQEVAMLNTEDLMMDDENVSYPMDGVNIVQNESFHNLQMEDTEMRASEYGISAVHANAPENTDSLAISFEVIGDVRNSETHNADSSSRSLEGEKIRDLEAGFGDVESTNEAREVDEKEVENTKSSPYLSSAPTKLAADTYNSSLPAQDASDTETEAGSKYVRVSNDGIPSALSSEEHERENDFSVEDRITILASHVVVMYREAEYGLVSLSATDDPDSFFLKEAAIVNGPMSDLMTALREVISDDLDSDDELCLSIEDFGVEINETCSSIGEMNFVTIFDLYSKLLRNEGVEDPVRLCVTLSTKPSFAKRLATLTAGASEGKGLSELISWNDTGDNLDRSQSLEDEELNQENSYLLKQDEDFIESTETVENGPKYDAAGGEHPNGSPPSDLIPAKQSAVSEPAIKSPSEEATTNFSPETGSNDSSGAISAGEFPASVRRVSASATDSSSLANDDVDEDGDLIDYEDEDYLGVGEASESQSPYLAADHGDDVDINNGQTPGPFGELIADPDNMNFTDQAAADIADRNLNDVSDEHVDNLREDGDFQYFAGDTGSQDAGANDTRSTQYADKNAGHDSIFVPDKGGPTGTIFQPPTRTAKIGDESLEEIDYTIEHPELTPTTNTHIPKIFSPRTESLTIANQAEPDEDEISYEEAEITESNGSEQTLIAEDTILDHETATTEPTNDIDEINYETDDQQDPAGPLVSKFTRSQPTRSSDHGNKRLRGDTEDIVGQASQQSKRVRS